MKTVLFLHELYRQYPVSSLMCVSSDWDSIDFSHAKVGFFCLPLVSVLFYSFVSKVDEGIGKVLLNLCE